MKNECISKELQNIPEIVLDVETLGLRRSSIVTEVAIKGVEDNRVHSFRIDVISQMAYGYTYDLETLKMFEDLYKTSNEDKEYDRNYSRQVLFFDESIIVHLKAIIQDIVGKDNFENMNYLIWCEGTDFDIPMLSKWFDTFKSPCIWKYNMVRDIRTLRSEILNFIGMTEEDFKINSMNEYFQSEHIESIPLHAAVPDVIYESIQVRLIRKLLKDYGSKR